MIPLFIVLFAVSLLILIIVSGVRPIRTTMSQFELERRADAGDTAAIDILRRERLLPDVISLQRVVAALFLVMSVLLSISAFGWLFGIIIAFIIALEYGAIAHIGVLQRQSQKLYQLIEPKLLNIVDKAPPMFVLLRSVPGDEQTNQTLDSREELHYLIKNAGSILTHEEKQFLTHGLGFNDQLVGSIMTPRSVIDSVTKAELLGPLALDDLHKTGHSRFPVIDGDIDHVVGMLHIQDLFTLGDKKSVSAEKAMEPRVYYIHEKQNLAHALAAFLRTRHHLFVVVNEFRETVGLLSLEDVIEALLGHKIIDEFDAHEDLRVVATRNPRANNHPQKGVDV